MKHHSEKHHSDLDTIFFFFKHVKCLWMFCKKHTKNHRVCVQSECPFNVNGQWNITSSDVGLTCHVRDKMWMPSYSMALYSHQPCLRSKKSNCSVSSQITTETCFCVCVCVWGGLSFFPFFQTSCDLDNASRFLQAQGTSAAYQRLNNYGLPPELNPVFPFLFPIKIHSSDSQPSRLLSCTMSKILSI